VSPTAPVPRQEARETLEDAHAAEPLRRGAMQVRFRVRVMRLATHTHTRICADACAVAPRSAWRRAAAWR
jgi:hypothetical protein